MRMRLLGLLLSILVLLTAPGCRVLGGAAAVVGAAGLIVAEGVARGEAYQYPGCDHHSAAPPMGPCR